MAADEVDLTFLGEQIKSMQADMRRIDTQVALIREKIVLIEAEQVELRSMLVNATGEFTLRMIGLERRFDGLERRFDGLERRFDGLERRFDGLEHRFDGLEHRFDGLEHRFDGLEHRFDGLERRFERFEASVDARFRQIEETAATNLQILLAAINGRGAPTV